MRLPLGEPMEMRRANGRSFFNAVWVGAWLAIAAGAYVVAASAGGSAPQESLRSSGTTSAELNGVEATVRLVTVSAIDSVVVVAINGRESEGATVNLLGRSVLVLDDGTRLDEMSGDVDGRSVELRFSAVPSGRTIAELLLTGVALSRQLPGLAEDGDRTMVGGYALAIPSALIEFRSSPKIDVQASAPFGPGTLHVSEVIRDSDHVVIRGSITGLTERQIQEITIADARLHLGDSSDGLVSGRAGFGDGLRPFELRFAVGTEAESGVLEFVLTTTPVPFEPDEDLASYVGSVARLNLPIPSLPR